MNIELKRNFCYIYKCIYWYLC